MHNNEVSSLISLLDDEDSEVVSVVMDRLCAKGEEAMPLLESAWHNAFEGLQMTRLEHVIAQIQENTTLAKLKEWVKKGAPDTLTGAYYIAKLFRPNIEFNHIKDKVEALCHAVWMELHAHLTALEQVRIINHFIYYKHKFVGQRLVDSDRLLLLSDLLQNKEGCQISLGLLYSCVAERLNIPITGINFSQSAMLGYVDAGSQDMFFFIDPCNGELFGKPQMLHAIAKYISPQKSTEHHLLSCSRQTYVRRYVSFLSELYRLTDKPQLQAKANRAVEILSGKKVR